MTVADVMQGIDYVTKTLKKGDPSKLFVCGGSHGNTRIRLLQTQLIALTITRIGLQVDS